MSYACAGIVLTLHHAPTRQNRESRTRFQVLQTRRDTAPALVIEWFRWDYYNSDGLRLSTLRLSCVG